MSSQLKPGPPFLQFAMPPKKGKQRSAVEKKDSSSGEFEHISLASALDSAIQDGGGEAAAANDAVPQPAAEAAAAPVEPGEAAEAAARAAGAAAGEDSQADPMRELEEATARAAEQAMVAARQAAKGLSAAGGWLSGLVKSGLQAVQAEAVPSSPSRAEEAEGLRRQLGLPEGEAVLESFSCQVRRRRVLCSAVSPYIACTLHPNAPHPGLLRSSSKPTSRGTTPSRPRGWWPTRGTSTSPATTSALSPPQPSPSFLPCGSRRPT